jgi:hypothetical protein
MNNEQLEGRFWSKVKKTTDCWLWIGSKGTRGYGQFWNGIKTVRAHRFVWEVTNGLIPEGLYVCHRCDNPLCVNPTHLFLGTQQDNMNDSIAKGRRDECYLHGEAHPGHKLTEGDVTAIREIRSSQRDIARRFRISRRTVVEIIRGKKWKHLLNAEI